MKKIALFMLLSVAAPVCAVISDAEYAQEVAKRKNQIFKDHGADSEKYIKDFAQNPLPYFVSDGNLPAVQYLIEVKGVNPNQAEPIEGDTPLMNAVRYRQAHIVKYLLEHGADRNIRDEFGQTAKDIVENYATHRTVEQEIRDLLELESGLEAK